MADKIVEINNANDITDEEKQLIKKRQRELDEINKDAKEKSLWVNMDDDAIQDIVNSFSEYSDEMNIDWEKFDFREFDADYYKKRFPKFTDDIIDILVRCSNSKIYDDTRLLPIKEDVKDEDFTVDFS